MAQSCNNPPSNRKMYNINGPFHSSSDLIAPPGYSSKPTVLSTRHQVGKVKCTFSSKQRRKYDPDAKAVANDMICFQSHYFANNNDS
ncbi:Hypothetical predicted protein [Podarcis lilfordi]|uniref:Uncharacterized protein n=1 Tax=Podarcis lilfordi TaxID=74358 RepID=A0AA35P464_9SAUR|nr:Hypothetical predicted protein [Podarcis lilfordi]